MKRIAVYLMLMCGVIMALAPAVHADCRAVVRHRAAPVHAHAPVVAVEKTVVPIKAVAAVVEFITPVLPIYTVAPSYGALFVPPVAGAYPGAAPYAPPAAGVAPGSDHCAETKAAMSLLQQRIGQLERGLSQPARQLPPMPRADGGNGTPPPAAPPVVPESEPQPSAAAPGSGSGFLALAQNRCASCHERATARLKGGSFVMFDNGKPADLTAQQSGNVLYRVLLPDGHPDQMPRGSKMTAEQRLEFSREFVGKP